MPIAFTNTPANTRNPGFYFEVDASQANSGATPKRALILGFVGNGVQASGLPELCPSPSYARAAYGSGSQLANMVVRYRRQDPYGQIWTLPVPTPQGATAGTLETTFAGTPTAAGYAYIYVCGALVAVPVAAGASAASIARAYENAANVPPDLAAHASMPGTGASATLLMESLGQIDLDVRSNYLGNVGGQSTPPGLTVSHQITAGTGLPDLATALANVSDMAFDIIISAWSDTNSLNALQEFLSDAGGRWSPTRLLFGHAFTARRSNLSDASTFLATRNDQHATLLPVDNSPEPDWVIAADMAATIANPIRNDPSLPVAPLAMGWLPPPVANRFDFSERDVLLADGGSTYVVGDDNVARTSRLVTTYLTNGFGVPDDAYLDVETPFQLAAVIQFYQADFSSTYFRKRLLKNFTRFGAGDPNSVTPQIVQTHALALYRQLMARGWVQDDATFQALCTAEIVGEGRLNLLLPITLANQLRIVASLVQFTKP